MSACAVLFYSIVTTYMVNTSAVGIVIFGICVEGNCMSYAMGLLFIH